MAARRLAALLAAAAALLTGPAASANPSLAPTVLQCDGTYTGGTNPLITHTPTPSLRVTVSDATGLRIGQSRMGVVPNLTNALWRFDNATNNVTLSYSCADSGGPQWTGTYTYADPDGSDPVDIGHCTYALATSVGGQTCSNTTFDRTLAVLVSSRLPMGLGACNPGTPGTAPPAAGTMTVFPNSAQGSNFGGMALLYSTNTQYGAVTYSAASWQDLDRSYTISAWVRFTGTGPQRLLSEQGAAGIWGIGFGTNTITGAQGGLRSIDSRDVSTSSADVTLGSGYNDGQWHQIHVIRRNGVDRRYYVDGKLIGTVVAASSDSFVNHPIRTPVYIGAAAGTGEYFNGQIDEIREIDGSISDDDVLLEYLGTVHKYSSNNGVVYSTVPGSFLGGTPANGVQSVVTYLPGEVATSSSAWIFAAQSTQTLSTVMASLSVTIDRSSPTAPTPSGTPSSTNDITWTWGAPSKVCPPPGSSSVYYQLADGVTGAVLNPPGQIAYPASSIGENIPGSPNQLRSRRLLLTDVWGTSPLSASASAYTLAAPPVSPAVASVSSGGFVFSWDTAGNPGYTRYEVTYSSDPSFATGLATRAAVTDGLVAGSINITGLLTGTTYYARVRAFNGSASDFLGGVPTTSTSTKVVTQPAAPLLAATALSSSSIRWDWNAVSGAASYALYDTPTQAAMFSGPAVTFTSSTLSANTRYDAEIAAAVVSPTPPSPRGRAFTYTWANPPLAPTISAVYPSSASFTWGANGNPAYTFYQVVIAADPAYDLVIATLSVTATTATVTGLLPGTAYYAKVQAVNGAQNPTGFVAIGSTATAADAVISASSAPASPYVAPSGLVGAWQFDEGSGLTTADASGNGNIAGFTCVTAACASTPTFVSGPAGLGTAASFSGLAGVVLTNTGAPLNVAGSLTVEAWVNPQTSAQIAGAGIAAVGPQNAEDFALDVSSHGAFRFLTSNAGASVPVTVATAAVAAGRWTHVVGVYDAVHATSTLYLNGRPAAVIAGVPVRSHSAQVLSIGNRQNASGTYALPFFGSIDSVRVLARALTASEVLSDYLGSFVSSVTLPNGGVIVGLPPNAFGAPAQIYISTDPAVHPIRVPPASLSAGLSAIPSGLTMAPNTLVEVVPIVGGLPYTTPLGSSATLAIPYADADGNNLIDGTNPPLPASSLRMYTLNTTVNRWEALPSTLDAANRRVIGVTPHFSVFALFATPTVGADLSGVRVYPVPWKPGSGGRFDAAGVTFDGLPASGSIRILTLAGQRVREFAFGGGGAGRAVWDGNNDAGRRAASGVYFARVLSSVDNKAVLLKFAVER